MFNELARVIFTMRDIATSLAGNQDLFMSSLNWLLDREELMAIAPKPIEDIKISLTRKQLRKQIMINVVGIPFIAAVLGILVWFRQHSILF